MQIDFPRVVTDAFSFLTDAGFAHVEPDASSSIVRFRKGDLEAVVFRDSQSYEIGFQIGFGSEKYSTSEIIRLADQNIGNEYRDYTAKDNMELSHALTRLAGLIKIYGKAEISGDRLVFSALRKQRQSWSENYALEVLASQMRPKAEEAFRKGDYVNAVNFYKKFEKQLTNVEIRKLAMAQERSCSQI